MTFDQALTEHLISCMLFPKEASAALGRLHESKASASMKDRWRDDISGYPPSVLFVMRISAEAEAVKYLEETKPNHFALDLLRR